MVLKNIYFKALFIICMLIASLRLNSISVHAFVEDSELRLATEVFGEVGASVIYQYPDTLIITNGIESATMKFKSRLVYRGDRYYTLDREVVVYNNRAYVSPDAIEKTLGIPERTVDPSRPMICLTFDDGPFSPTTEPILDILEIYNSKATFFVVGDMIWQYPQTLKREHNLGMGIGNHTYYHPCLPLCSLERMVDEINMTNHDARLVLNQSLDIMRPPHGETNEMVRAAIELPIILWSLDTLDWENLDSGIIYNRVMNNVKDGDIILMHDTLDCTRVSVSWMVPALIERGFQLVTVEEMMRAKGLDLQPGMLYFSANS